MCPEKKYEISLLKTNYNERKGPYKQKNECNKCTGQDYRHKGLVGQIMVEVWVLLLDSKDIRRKYLPKH